MICIQPTSDNQRTSLDEAIRRVLRVLQEEKGANITQLAKAAGLNWKTADKVMTLLTEISVALEGKGIDAYDTGQSKMYLLTDRVGLESLPASLRDLYVRKEFPKATDEQRLLVGLMLKGATSARMAVRMERVKQADTLLQKGRIKRTKDEHAYLTEIGMRIARGTLITYPELVKDQHLMQNSDRSAPSKVGQG